jgi:hypothetical protein
MNKEKDYSNPHYYCVEQEGTQGTAPTSSERDGPTKPMRKTTNDIWIGLCFMGWGLCFLLFLLYIKWLGLSLYLWADWAVVMLGFTLLLMGIMGICIEGTKER